MIEIKSSPAKAAGITRTNDIPVGQVFRGEIYCNRSHVWTSGLFYKAFGTYLESQGAVRDFVIVRLDRPEGTSGYANLWDKCSDIRKYEPLKAVIDLQPM